MKSAHLVLGNQLFKQTLDKVPVGGLVFICEDEGLCTYFRFHQQKIVMFLASMRHFADFLRENGREVYYSELSSKNTKLSYEDKLLDFVRKNQVTCLQVYEIEDQFFRKRIESFCLEHKIKLLILESPMFLTSTQQFSDYLQKYKRPFMKTFYESQRKRLGILVDGDGSPIGGRWSFDDENRKKLPKNILPPIIKYPAHTKHVVDVIGLVENLFADHPGRASDFSWPVDFAGWERWLHDFLRNRFADFGAYEDAISTKSSTVYHSLISPALNIGLLTPDQVVQAALRQKNVSIASMEGFIRQVIGWREFVRGVYNNFDFKKNFWNHQRPMSRHWYEGTTGIDPIDHVIRQVLKTGYCHHIERLMVLGSAMLLSEIDPQRVHAWFMEMFVDSSDWVMEPNVFGMSQFADGGIFATKPYICGSNYILKMSDFTKGPWCDTLDGLYWRFIAKHSEFFSRNPRLSMIAKTLEKMDPGRKAKLFAAAESFIEKK